MYTEVLGKSSQCIMNARDSCDLETLIVVSTELSSTFSSQFLNGPQTLLPGGPTSRVWGGGVAVHLSLKRNHDRFQRNQNIGTKRT